MLTAPSTEVHSNYPKKGGVFWISALIGACHGNEWKIYLVRGGTLYSSPLYFTPCTSVIYSLEIKQSNNWKSFINY